MISKHKFLDFFGIAVKGCVCCSCTVNRGWTPSSKPGRLSPVVPSEPVRPRIMKGKSGAWWCVSNHRYPTMTTPLGRKVYQRVGTGDTPREAYDCWVAW